MAWQYCKKCDGEINPSDIDFIRGCVQCPECSTIIETEDEARNEVLINLYQDVQKIKLAARSK